MKNFHLLKNISAMFCNILIYLCNLCNPFMQKNGINEKKNEANDEYITLSVPGSRNKSR